MKYEVSGYNFDLLHINPENHVFEYLLVKNDSSFYFSARYDTTDWSVKGAWHNFQVRNGDVKILTVDTNPHKLFQISTQPGGSRQIFTIDEFPEIKWRLTNDFKKIMGYEARKATATFRGRDYTAYFTPAIPISEGPWKLKGLPGLILEAYDSEQYYVYTATEIIKNSDYDFPKAALDFLKTHQNEGMLYKDYIKLQDENIEMMRQRAMASMPQGTGAIIRDDGGRTFLREKSFEWQIDTSSLNTDGQKYDVKKAIIIDHAKQ